MYILYIERDILIRETLYNQFNVWVRVYA